jgi:hypothetical protein
MGLESETLRRMADFFAKHVCCKCGRPATPSALPDGCLDAARVPDLLSAEGLGRSSGRGLLLIRAHVTRVRHNARGNRVTLIRRRSAS